MENPDSNEMYYCYGCMSPMDRPGGLCPHCGYDNSKQQNEPDLLPEGTILAGKYLVGRRLGRGGFGVTYLGCDLVMERVVAIRELFPLGICTRLQKDDRVTFYSIPNVSEIFTKMLRAFRNEAINLSKFDSPNIVRVRDYLSENETAYVIMDYVRGHDFGREILEWGRIPWQRVISLFNPLILALESLHRNNLMHGDIKPGKIRVSRGENGSEHLVLTDFASSIRNICREDIDSSYTDALVLSGYEPFELYGYQRAQGPFTDVYGLCATMYHAITGEIPTPALKVLVGNESLKTFRDFGLDVPDHIEKAICHGLVADPVSRTKSMTELYQELNLVSDESEPSEVQTANSPVSEKEPIEKDSPKALKSDKAGKKQGKTEIAPDKGYVKILLIFLAILAAAAARALFLRPDQISFQSAAAPVQFTGEVVPSSTTVSLTETADAETAAAVLIETTVAETVSAVLTESAVAIDIAAHTAAPEISK